MVKIFVEGIADIHFLKHYIKHIYNKELTSEDIVKTDGWNNIGNSEFVTQLKKSSDNGLRNVVLFDADVDSAKRTKELQEMAKRNGVTYDIFLFPDNRTSGSLEDLLMRIVNPVNTPVTECWDRYEEDLKQQTIPWKNPTTPTTPSIKTRVYAYLEALLGESKSQKEYIKEARRRYDDTNHWDLDSPALQPLKDFLDKMGIAAKNAYPV